MWLDTELHTRHLLILNLGRALALLWTSGRWNLPPVYHLPSKSRPPWRVPASLFVVLLQSRQRCCGPFSRFGYTDFYSALIRFVPWCNFESDVRAIPILSMDGPFNAVQLRILSYSIKSCNLRLPNSVPFILLIRTHGFVGPPAAASSLSPRYSRAAALNH
jgi:hypothetical protein